MMPFKSDFNKEIVVILQARTGSTRLPNKIIRCLQGKTLLSHCIQRLKSIDGSCSIIVATSNLNKDDPVEELAHQEGVFCFRGSENDVLDRYYQAAKSAAAKYVVRVTGDNPLVDPIEAKRVINYIIGHELDYVTGTEEANGLKLPIGVGVESFTFDALERSWLRGKEIHHREHVNEYILENPELFNIAHLSCLPENNCPDLSLTVDTKDEFEFIEGLLASFNKPAIKISTSEIIEWWGKRRNL